MRDLKRDCTRLILFLKEFINFLSILVSGILSLISVVVGTIFVLALIIIIPIIFFGIIFGSIGAVSLCFIHFFQSIF